MTDSSARRSGGFFDDLLDARTYLNLAYLLMAFPLGLAYFVVLVTGFSLGAGLSVIGVGLAILAAMAGVVWALAAFERGLTSAWLGVDVPVAPRPAVDGAALARLGAYLSGAAFWKSVAYLLVRFPLGVASFVVVVTLGALSAALLTAPFTYSLVRLEVASGWTVGSPAEALFLGALGVVVAAVSARVVNALADVHARVAWEMLGDLV